MSALGVLLLFVLLIVVIESYRDVAEDKARRQREQREGQQ